MISQKSPALVPIGTHAAAGDFTMAAVIQKWMVVRRVDVRRLCAVVKTAITVTSAVITFKKYPTYDATGSAATIGTVTIPAGVVAGKFYFKDVAALSVKPGEMIVAEVTGTSTAGNGSCAVEVEDSPEDYRNNTNMVASA
jgi:hypothetical protein